MKTPEFWKDKKSLAAKLLFLPSCLFYFISKLDKCFKKTYQAKLKVICVGNIVVGGSGKTPIAIKIAEILEKNGKKIAFLSRGYKGRLSEVIVDKEIHTSEDVGDEPLLLSGIAPTIVAKNRALGAKIAEKMGIEYLIMDDGFQNMGLKKDFSILVFDGAFGLGNELLLPAGPLRERLDEAVKRADLAIISGVDKSEINLKLKNKIEVLEGSIIPDLQKIGEMKKDKFIAFAGIGRPDKFYDTLKDNQIDVIKFLSFPDHYFYKEQDMEAILKCAKENNAKIITTSKDYVKVSEKYKQMIDYLPVKFHFHNEEEIISCLLSI